MCAGKTEQWLKVVSATKDLAVGEIAADGHRLAIGRRGRGMTCGTPESSMFSVGN
jgi:hypothetical protein